MSILRLNVDDCQNCYKCIRECPLKAIEFKEMRSKIIEDECVLCGHCMEICPRGAKYYSTHVDRVKALVKSDKPVYVSIAPSYVGWYPDKSFAAVNAALKKLGFTKAEETAIGAAQVTHEYEKLMEAGEMKTIIATACTSAVMLIERHFPLLIKNLAPVSSPMMAHARLMRESYGDIKVVFIGPCISKIYEAQDPLAGGLINEVLTFEDLDMWLKSEGVSIGEEDGETTGVKEPVSRLYPKQEGIIRTIGDNFHGYTPISVDGMDRCIDVFSRVLAKNDEDRLFIEANICAGACIGGPVMRMHRKSILVSTARLKKEAVDIDKTPSPSAEHSFTHPRVFANRAAEQQMPTEQELTEILARFGKTSPDKELNCGSCGYGTCRQKAIAVFQGKADVSMCLPYLREQAENMSSIIIENSPNGIMTFDEDMNVTQINPKAELLFGVKQSEIMGNMIPALYGETAFDMARETGFAGEKKCNGADESVSVELSVVYLKDNRMFVAFAKDISEQEQNKNELETLRLSTVDVAQNVIDKQMRVAQEIASLLGETTAETKVALTKLKKTIQDISE